LSQGFSADWLLGPAAPVINHATFSGGKLVMSGSGGLPGMPFRMLTSTNIQSPLANWLRVTTNAFRSDGTFSYTNSNPASAAFFRLVAP
jgi:hypothetical protein